MNATFLSVAQLGASLALLAAAIGPAAAGGATDTALHANLQVLVRRTLFFGHQSVGLNILEGMAELARQEGISLPVAEARTALGAAPGALTHGAIAENGDPLRKIESFQQYFSTGVGGAPAVAFMKFCYADFHRGIDVAALFARYQAALADLRGRYPGTTFVHFTAPLTTAPGGWRPVLGRLMGRDTSEAQNARREAFNALLRQAYLGKEPLFDLARVESTDPDGRPVAVEQDGRAVPALAAAYSDDGGHLNAVGRRVVARRLVDFLAALPAAPAPERR